MENNLIKMRIKEIHERPAYYVRETRAKKAMLLKFYDELLLKSPSYSHANPTNHTDIADKTATVAILKQRLEEPLTVYDEPMNAYEELEQAIMRYKHVVNLFSDETCKTILLGRLEGKTNVVIADEVQYSPSSVTKRLKKLTEEELDEKIDEYLKQEEEQKVKIDEYSKKRDKK